jgi:hypothetical protein
MMLFSQNAVSLEVAKLHLTDHSSINSENLRSQIRRRLFSSTIPMRPWFPLSLAPSELKTMLQDSLTAQRRLVSTLQAGIWSSFSNNFLSLHNRNMKPSLGGAAGFAPDALNLGLA